MKKYFDDTTIDPEAPACYVTIDEKIEKHNRHYKKKKIFFSILFVLFCAASVSYFALPFSQVGHALSISGNKELAKEEILSLMEMDGNENLLLVNSSQCQKKLSENSNDLVLSSSIRWSPFSLSVDIREDVPLALYNGEGYYLSGHNQEEIEEKLSSSLLSTATKTKILSSYEEKIALDVYQSDLFNLYLPSGEAFSTDFTSSYQENGNRQKVMANFKDVSSDYLSHLVAVQFKSEDTSNYSNVFDAIFCNDCSLPEEERTYIVVVNLIPITINNEKNCIKMFVKDIAYESLLDACEQKEDLVYRDYTLEDGTVYENCYIIRDYYPQSATNLTFVPVDDEETYPLSSTNNS